MLERGRDLWPFWLHWNRGKVAGDRVVIGLLLVSFLLKQMQQTQAVSRDGESAEASAAATACVKLCPMPAAHS
jgi:hypothetical protein